MGNNKYFNKCLKNGLNQEFSDFAKIFDSAHRESRLSRHTIEYAFNYCKNSENLLCEFFAWCIYNSECSEWDVFLRDYYGLPDYMQQWIRENYYIDNNSYPDDSFENVLQRVNL